MIKMCISSLCIRLVVVMLCLTGAVVWADAVVLTSTDAGPDDKRPGRIIEGCLASADKRELVLETFTGRIRIPRDRIYQHNTKKTGDFEEYERQAEALCQSAEGQLKLAKICRKHNGWEKARTHLMKAVELEPENKAFSKTVTGLLDKLAESEKAARDKLPRPRALTARVAVVQELPDAEMERVVDEAKRAAALLIRISEKQIYFAEIIFTMPGSGGHLIYDKTFTGIPNGTANIKMGVRNWCAPVIIHELGHALLGLPDDDGGGLDTRNWGKSLYPCIMAHLWDKGFGLCCQRALGLGRFGKFADLLVDEIPEPPPVRITIDKKDKKK